MLNSQECVSLVRTTLRSGQSPSAASQQLAELAMKRYSLDNLSVIVVVLQSPNRERDRDIERESRDREGWWMEDAETEERYVLPRQADSRRDCSSSNSTAAAGPQQQQQQPQAKPDRPRFDFSALKALL